MNARIILCAVMLFGSGCAALNIRIVRGLSEAELRERSAAEERRLASVREDIASLLSGPMPRSEFEARLHARGAKFSRVEGRDLLQAVIALQHSESGGGFYHLDLFVRYKVDAVGTVVSASSEEGAIIGCPAAPRPELRDWKIQR